MWVRDAIVLKSKYTTLGKWQNAFNLDPLQNSTHLVTARRTEGRRGLYGAVPVPRFSIFDFLKLLPFKFLGDFLTRCTLPLYYKYTCSDTILFTDLRYPCMIVFKNPQHSCITVDDTQFSIGVIQVIQLLESLNSCQSLLEMNFQHSSPCTWIWVDNIRSSITAT